MSATRSNRLSRLELAPQDWMRGKKEKERKREVWEEEKGKEGGGRGLIAWKEEGKEGRERG